MEIETFVNQSLIVLSTDGETVKKEAKEKLEALTKSIDPQQKLFLLMKMIAWKNILAKIQ